MRFGSGLAAVLCLALAGAARAQPPATPVSLALGYDGVLLIKVMDIHFDEQATTTGFADAASLRSYGLLATFKKFDVKASAHGRIEDGAPRPDAFAYDNRDGKRERRVQVAWRGGEVTMASTPTFRNLGQPAASLEQKLAAVDPLTQLMRITLAAAPQAICGTTPHMFDGKQLYGLEFDRAQPVDLDADQRALGVTGAVQCALRYREIAGFKAKPPEKRDQGLKAMEVTFGQIGAGGPWVIARLTAATPLGPASITLKSARVSHDARLAWE